MLLFEPIFNNFQAKALLFFSLFIKSSTIRKIQAYLVKKGARFKQAIRIHLVHHAINHPYMSQCLFIIQPGLVHWWHVGGGRRAHVTLATGDRIGNDQRKHSLVHMASLLFWQNWQGVFFHCCSLAGKWDSQIMQVNVLRFCIAILLWRNRHQQQKYLCYITKHIWKSYTWGISYCFGKKEAESIYNVNVHYWCGKGMLVPGLLCTSRCLIGCMSNVLQSGQWQDH